MKWALAALVWAGCADRPLYLPEASADMAQEVAARTFFAEGNGIQSPQAVASAAPIGCDFPGGIHVGRCCLVPDPAHLVDFYPSHDIGRVEFRDGPVLLAAVDYDRTAGGYPILYSTEHPEIQWNAGDGLSVSTSGGAVPAFTAGVEAVQLPSGVDPPFDVAQPITVASDDGLTVRFDAQRGAHFALSVDDASSGSRIFCDTEPDEAQLLLPSGALNLLGPGRLGLTLVVERRVAAGPRAFVSSVAAIEGVLILR
jgi:hypothetical protein